MNRKYKTVMIKWDTDRRVFLPIDERKITLDQRAEQAKAEIRAQAQQAIDAISVKVGWMLRSIRAKQGWRNRKAK